MNTTLIWLSVFIVVDGALLAGTELALCIQYLNPKRWVLPSRTALERGALAGAFVFMLIQTICALLWDLWHDNTLPQAQFPIVWRIVLSVPALLLTNWSLMSRMFRLPW